MADSLTISTAPLKYPGMDYAFLRQEGIKSIQQLAGSRWTDYNSHDPGITILEALCYAVTDLSYRLSFSIEDLLAQPDSVSTATPLFLTARDILTINPLTITDYRKLLIDIDGIKNAWLEPIYNPQPQLYYDAASARLSFSSQNLAEPVRIKGLYRVLIEPEFGYENKVGELVAAATTRLQRHRNLCEDFAEVTTLGFEEITVRAELEIVADADPQRLMGQIHTALAYYISPFLPFLRLPALLARGTPVEDIFSGPMLDHGFLDDAQVQQFDRKTELYTSDLIRIILDIPGVTTVRHMTLTSQGTAPQEWALKLDSQLTPRLKSLGQTIQAGDIKFYKGQIEQPLATPTQSQTPPSSSQSSIPSNLDLPIPTGDYRELSNYTSVQSEFPLTYGIGEIGLPASALSERKAEAKQLQAYLMVFDQLLANYFAQLDHVRDLFSLNTDQIQTYFSQSIAHFPGGKEILQATYADHRKQASTDAKIDLDRKNRLLDHLIAQYGETFTNHSLLYPNQSSSDTLLKRKTDFARDYRQVSAGRGQAFNYTRNPNNLKNVSNVSGLKRRVARLLGIDPDRQFLASDIDKEGFYIVEHLLLRPRQAPSSSLSSAAGFTTSAVARPAPSASDFLSFSQPITEFKTSDTPGHLTCTSPNHRLKAGNSIDIFYSTYYSGTYRVLDNPTTDTFDIAHPFVTKDSGEWVRSNHCPDPFSFQISVILPDWPARFRNIKQLIHDILVAETPAHITLHLHWLNQAKMREFETIYALWLQYLSGTAKGGTGTEAEASATRLINFLELGSTDIPAVPALIGYTTISEGANDSTTPNPFKVSPNRSEQGTS
ncbi:MAG: hypothetical protein AAF921_00840 [Cyanobacteria bacterium P01_D01_bin.44]